MKAPRLARDWIRIRTVNVVRSDLEKFAPGELLERQQLGAQFAGAYHQGKRIQVAIGRRSSGVFWAAGMDDGDASMLFPSCGAESFERSRLASLVADMSWVSASLGIHDQQEPRGTAVPDLEVLLETADSDHVWLVEAEPLDLADEQTIQRLERQVSLGGRAGGFRERHEAERAERILEHLLLRGHVGVWRTKLYCGSVDAGSANALLGRLIGISGMQRLPVSVSIQEESEALLTSECLGALARGPVTELPGVQLRHRPRWDLNPEVSGPIEVGSILNANDEPVRKLSVGLSTLNRHVFVSGATGSGKSETVRRLLEQLTAAGVPWLVIEPAKAEYHKMAGVIAPEKVVLIRLGSGNHAVTLNPLEPSSTQKGGDRQTFPLATHIAMIRELFAASFDIEDPFPQILSVALEKSYEALGWDTATGEYAGGEGGQGRYPLLSDLRRHALAAVDELGYGREVSDNVRAAVDVRINSLRNGSAGRFFETGHPIDLDALATKNVVLQIEDLGNERDQAFLIGAVLIRWTEMLRLKGDSAGELRHMLVIEEAHRLLRATEDARSSSIEQFANLLAEVRAYGQGVIVAEQIPSKLISDVIKNSALKIMHRLPSLDDRDVVGATMNLEQAQSESVVSFAPGRAAVHADGMDRPILVSVAEPPRSHRAKLDSAPVMTRSESCSAECSSGSRCSQKDLAAASRLATDDAFQLWVDFAVMASVTGEVPIMVVPAHLNRWKRIAVKRRHLRCALGIAADVSVGARALEMFPFYEPAELARSLSDSMEVAVSGRAGHTADTRWQLAEFRWVDLEVDLKRRLQKDQQSEGVDPAAASGRGLVLKTRSAADQLGEIDQQHQALRSDFDAKVYGKPAVVTEVARSRKQSPAGLLAWLGVREPWLERALRLEYEDGEKG